MSGANPSQPNPSQPKPFGVEAVRRDFPILAREVYGKRLVYLDNASSAQKPSVVLEAMESLYREDYANVHRGLHFLSTAATERYEEARRIVAAFLNAESVDEIVFTRNSTEAINLVAASFGAVNIGKGDEIVLSIMEHHSNIVPWHFHRERNGAVLKFVPIRDDGSFDIEAFEKSLSEKTKIVAITQMSNVLGTMVPVKEVCAIAHRHGIPVLIDGSQGAVHLPVDVRDIDCDFYVVTGHKLYGPTGIGVLYAKRKHLDAMPPFNGGGEMIREVTTENVTYGAPPHKFEAGTPAFVEAVGLGAALTYLSGLDRQAVAAHEHSLLAAAEKRLSGMKGITLYGNAPGKGAIIAFNMAGAHAHDVATVIDRHGVAVRAGTHCAQPLLARFGVSATCRASFGLYNTLEEVELFANALEKAHGFFA